MSRGALPGKGNCRFRKIDAIYPGYTTAFALKFLVGKPEKEPVAGRAGKKWFFLQIMAFFDNLILPGGYKASLGFYLINTYLCSIIY
jgi:hypothetical protein